MFGMLVLDIHQNLILIFFLVNFPILLQIKILFMMFVHKQNKHVFLSLTMSTSSHCFELIHVDIWDAFLLPSIIGSCSFLTIVDDYSQCILIYLMKNKL